MPKRRSASQPEYADDPRRELREGTGVALYARVASVLRGRIARGEWDRGQQLPTMEQLAETFGVATITIRQAVRILVAEGLLSSARGRGTHVLRNSSIPAASDGLRAAINDPTLLGPDHSITILLREDVKQLPAELDSAYTQVPRYRHVSKLHN